MCVAIPSRVIEVKDGEMAVVERYGEVFQVSTALLLEPVQVGDYLTIQAQSFATQRLDEEAAKETLALIEEFARASFPQEQAG